MNPNQLRSRINPTELGIADGSASLRCELRKLRRGEESTDFTIRGTGGREIPCHLFVLAGRCARFAGPDLARAEGRTYVLDELTLGGLAGDADAALGHVVDFLYSDETPDVDTDPGTLVLFGKICSALGGPPLAMSGGQIVPASRSSFSLEPALHLPESEADLVVRFVGPGDDQRQWFLSSALCSCQSTFFKGFLSHERTQRGRKLGADDDAEAKTEAEAELLGSRNMLTIEPSSVLPSSSTLDLVIRFLHTGRMPLRRPKKAGDGSAEEDHGGGDGGAGDDDDNDDRGLRPEHALEVARYFGIPHLFVAVEHVLMDFVTAETVLDLWLLADNFYRPDAADQYFLGGDLLFETCLDCFCSNWTEVTRSEAFLSMPKRLLLEALVCGNIDESRESMMRTLILWANHQQALTFQNSSAFSQEATATDAASKAAALEVDIMGLPRILIDMLPPVTLFNARNKRQLTRKTPLMRGLGGVGGGLA